MADVNANSPNASPRYPVLDALRVIAMLDIVSIHVTDPATYLLGGMGLPVFIITAVALSVRRPELPTWRRWPGAAWKRAGRILLPWVVWCVFFGISRALGGAMTPDRSVADYFYPWMWGSGTSIHLWFLPYIFVAELAVLGVLAPLRRVPTGLVIGGALALAGACVVWTGAVYDEHAAAYWAMSMDSDDYDERAKFFGWMVRKSWLFGTASVCLGVAVGRTLSLSAASRRRLFSPQRWLLIGAVLLVGLHFVWDRYQNNPLVHGHAIWQWWRQTWALLLVAAAMQFTGNTPKWLMRIAVLTMGVYLLHGWVNLRIDQGLRLLYDTSVWRVLWPIGNVTENYYGRISSVWLLTLLFVALLRRNKTVRRVL
ncbi:MAG: acyltransferase [Planctomycetota bacterium]